jgi:lysophospholipase L1-like esterase
VWKPGGLRAETQLEKDGFTPEYAEKRADGWFEQYDIDGLQTASLENLLRELKNRGIRTAVVQIPRSELFEETIRRKYAAQQQAYFSKVSALAAQYGAEFAVMSNEGLVLEEHFRDTNHVNPKGAEIVSRRVAERWLKPG